MKKKLTVIFIFVILSLTLVTALKMNESTIEAQKELLNNAQILLKNKEDEFILSIDDLKSMEEEFEAVLDTSTTDPSSHTYTGVQVKNILSNYSIALNNENTIIVTGADGYSVAYSKKEVLEDNNIYIAFMEDGTYLGNKENGGRGPYESIVKSDQFSNRRCKWLTRIEVK